MNVKEAIAVLEAEITNPTVGLPIDIFNFVSRLTPLVNIDLLIKDEHNRTLLAWRDDEFSGSGWHIPGGIVRYKESLETRIQKTAEKELSCSVKFNPIPITMNQINCSHITRGHFISFLYECQLNSHISPNNIKPNNPGYLLWHESCPKNLISSHEMYRKYIL